MVDVRHFLTADYTDGTDGELGLEIGDIRITGFLASHDSLPIEARVFEIEEEGEFHFFNRGLRGWHGWGIRIGDQGHPIHRSFVVAQHASNRGERS